MWSRRDNGPTEMDTNLRITIASTTVASTCSLSPSVQDAPSQGSGDHTKMNKTKTGSSQDSGWSY